MKNKIVYCIDLDSARPRVMEYFGHVLEEDLRFYKTRNPLRLQTYDRKVFLTEKAASLYLKRFHQVLRKLPRLSRGGWEPGPSLIYKRHYLVQSFLGEKSQTCRSYKRNWRKGQVVKLYDQTYFLLVRLKSITKTKNGFKYSFTVLKQP